MLFIRLDTIQLTCPQGDGRARKFTTENEKRRGIKTEHSNRWAINSATFSS